MLRRFIKKDLTSAFLERTSQSLRFFSASASNNSSFDASSRAKYVKQQRQQVNIDEVLGASSRRSVYKSTERSQPCLYDFYDINTLTQTVKFEPDTKFDQDSFEGRVFNDLPGVWNEIHETLRVTDIYIKNWVQREMQRITKGVELTPQKQKKFNEIMEKALDIDSKNFEKEAPKLLKQLEDLSK